jgi:HD-like signal output (HDOD) protein
MDQQTNSLYKEKIFKATANRATLPPDRGQEISQLFNSQTISAKKVTTLIEKDPSLTLKVLSVANSPLYGLRRNVTNISTAVIMLGMREIKSIVTSIRMAATMKMKSDKYFNPDKFLNHSMIVGILTQRMAKDLGFNF